MRFSEWLTYVLDHPEPTITWHNGNKIEWWHDRVVEFCNCGEHPRTMTYKALVRAFNMRHPKN